MAKKAGGDALTPAENKDSKKEIRGNLVNKLKDAGIWRGQIKTGERWRGLMVTDFGTELYKERNY